MDSQAIESLALRTDVSLGDVGCLTVAESASRTVCMAVWVEFDNWTKSTWDKLE